MFRFSSAFFVSIILALFFFGACGKRGVPTPPSLVVPAKITDLRVSVEPGKRHLVWSLPSVNDDRSKPVDLRAFKVLLKKLPSGQDSCLFCDEGFFEYRTINLSKPSPGFMLGPSFYLPLPDVPEGFLYVFSVLSLNSRDWSSAVSNKLAVSSLPEVKPPVNLICQPSASVVDLDWQAPVMPDGFNGSLHYRVYRRDGGGLSHSWQMITPEPVLGTQYIDVGLSDWSVYEYAVTSFVSEGATFYESEFSHVAHVTSGDITPPPQLENVSAFSYQGAVQLIWSPSTAADLAGYRVYRRDSVTGIDKLVAVLPPSRHEYADIEINLDRLYYYRVTAFDQSERINESLPSPEVSVTVR